jgi:hypothetical protein
VAPWWVGAWQGRRLGPEWTTGGLVGHREDGARGRHDRGRTPEVVEQVRSDMHMRKRMRRSHAQPNASINTRRMAGGLSKDGDVVWKNDNVYGPSLRHIGKFGVLFVCYRTPT